MTKKNLCLALLVAVIIVVVIGIWQWQPKAPAPPLAEQSATSETVVQPAEDTTAAIQKDLESINLGDLNKEFKDADADIAGL